MTNRWISHIPPILVGFQIIHFDLKLLNRNSLELQSSLLKYPKQDILLQIILHPLYTFPP